MQQFIDNHPLILMEAAVVEQLRRAEGIELHPTLVNGPLIYERSGREALANIYRGYTAIAADAGLPMLLCAPTWRANQERVAASAAPATLNEDAVGFMQELRADSLTKGVNSKIGGLIGCRNDCYRPEQGMSAGEAEEFHAWQIERLAGSGVDFLLAATLPNTEEALGIARAMAKSGVAYIIGFVINRNGQVLDGSAPLDAIHRIDESVTVPPLGYMITCSYPDFLRADQQPQELFTRLIGYQANASSLAHHELDGSEVKRAKDLAAWGGAMLALHHNHGVKVLGGCCGTGVEHLQYLVDNVSDNAL